MTISFDEFKKVELTVGKILSAEKVAETEKLLRLQVGFGIKGDTTTPQSPPLKGGEEIPPAADGVLPFTKGESERRSADYFGDCDAFSRPTGARWTEVYVRDESRIAHD